MKIFKIILKVLLVVVLVISVTLNILCFGSSYGTLSVIYNEDKFISMNNYAFNTLESFVLNEDSKTGLQIEAINNKQCKKLSAHYYFDKDSNLSFSISCSKENYIENIYFSNGFLYSDNVKNSGQKTKEEMTSKEALMKAELNTDMMNLNSDTIKNNKVKTKLDFSFSPFYILGIKYKYKDLSETTRSYSYDLNGRLRKVKIINKEETTKYTINYKSKKITLPDLTSFN